MSEIEEIEEKLQKLDEEESFLDDEKDACSECPELPLEKVAENSSERITSVKEFAECILNLFKKFRTQKEKEIDSFLGVGKNEQMEIRQGFAPYQYRQAIWAINNFIKRKTKIVKIRNFEYSNSGEPPKYSSIEISRGKRESFLTIGSYFIHWKGVPLIVSLYFTSTCQSYRIAVSTKNSKIAKELNDEILEFMREKNLLKGQKLTFLHYGYLDFLDLEKVTWDEVILPEEIKEELMVNIIKPLKDKRSYQKVPYRRGLLLGGKVGTGKTLVCKVLANSLNSTIIWATPKALTTTGDVKQLFEAAREFAPTLIVIEDLDFIGEARELIKNPVLGELLSQLDGSSANSGVFVIATTNRPRSLDIALAHRPGRFDVKLPFQHPDFEQRKKLVELFSRNLPLSKEVNLDSIVRQTDGFSGAHLKEIFTHSYYRMKFFGRKEIILEDIRKAIKRLREREKSDIVV